MAYSAAFADATRAASASRGAARAGAEPGRGMPGEGGALV